MKKQSKTRYVILGALSIRNLSGYEIRKFIRETIGHFWAESNGQIYPSLHHLLQEGCIALCPSESSAKRQQTLYTLTPKGHAELTSWLDHASSAGEKNIQRDEGLLKLFFGNEGSLEENVMRVKIREQQIEAKLQAYAHIREKILTKQHSPHFLFWELTLENGITHAEAERAWCHRAIDKLTQRNRNETY